MKKKRTRICCVLMSLLMVLLVGCNAAPAEVEAEVTPVPVATAEPTGPFTDGTFTGSGSGMGGKIEVTVTVNSGFITNIEVGAHNETAGISDAAIERIPQAIIEAQSTSVDTVSGATMSSNGIMAAVENALSTNEGGASAIELTIKPDVIIVGGGLAGMTAATRASELGAKVLLVEQGSRLGGCLYYAGGSISGAGYKIQKEAGIEDTAQAYYDEIVAMNNGENINEELLMLYCEQSGPTIDWLEDYVKVDFGDRHVDGGGYQQTSAARVTYVLGMSPTGGAMGFVDAYTAKVDEFTTAGTLQVLLDTEVTELIIENNAVVGVKVGASEMRAPSVILATGGYGASEKWLTDTIFTNVATSDPAFCTGSGLDLAQSAGAALGNMDYISPYTGAIPVSGFTVSLRANVRYPGIVWVDKNGNRLVNEPVAAMDTKLNGKTWQELAQDNIVYLIINDAMIDAETNLINPAMGGAALDNKGWDRFKELIAEDKYGHKADSWEELGQKIGASNLAATMVQYNADCKAGKDSKFGRTDNLIAMEEGPYYAIKTIPWVLQTAGGPLINTKAQVLRADGSAIEGLYAAGELIGSANVDGHVTVGGFIHSFVSVFGKVAAENAIG